MKNITTALLTNAAANLDKLLVDASSTHQPWVITDKSDDAVLLLAEDW